MIIGVRSLYKKECLHAVDSYFEVGWKLTEFSLETEVLLRQISEQLYIGRAIRTSAWIPGEH